MRKKKKLLIKNIYISGYPGAITVESWLLRGEDYIFCNTNTNNFFWGTLDVTTSTSTTS